MTTPPAQPRLDRPHALRVGAWPAGEPVPGYGEARPRFSWRLPATWQHQSAYQVAVGDAPGQANLWDSGKVASDACLFVDFGGMPLVSRQRAWWRVRAWDEHDQPSAWSDTAHFELGLLGAEDWSAANWVVPPVEGERPRPCPHLRRAFTLDQPVTLARLYITARGVFEASLNGCRVGDDVLAPGWTEFDRRVHTLTYDVTSLLRPGDNAIDVVLADGWYVGMGERVIHGDRPELLAQLEITLADGSTQRIVTDGDWRATTGPITSASIYHGETHDARRETLSDWRPVSVKPHDPAVALQPKPMPSARVIETLRPVAVTPADSGRCTFDLGQNIVGLPHLRVPMRTGDTLTVRFAEMLNADGSLYTDNYRTAQSTDRHTAARDGVIDWRPRFTFHGFRYVELSGYDARATPTADWVAGLVIHTPMTATGTFTCSHQKLNRLQANIVWGQRGNFLEVPTDCPQRDERLGWTGDAQVFCPTACFNFDTLAFWRKWLDDLHDAQHEDGALPHVAPDSLRRTNPPDRVPAASAGWADAGVIVPWEVYVRTGDRGVLDAHYPMMTRWVGWYEHHARNFIVDHRAFGDWLQPYAQKQPDPRFGDTPTDLVCTAYFARSAEWTARAAAALGFEDEAGHYRTLRNSIRAAFAERFTTFDTQTGCLLALGFDLLPEARRASTLARLVELVHDAGDHLRTGFLGTPLLCPVLDRFGHTELAYRLLLTETYPSWLYSINQGATTMWERWNSYSHDAGFGDAKMNSFNHYAYGAIGQWLYERVAGLAPDPERPGYKHFFVRPAPGGGLTHARAALETPHGRAESAWRVEDGTFVLDVTAPANTSATVTLPDGATRRVPAGTFAFTARL